MPLSPQFTRSRAELVVNEGIAIVTTGRGDPREPIVQFLKEQGIKVLGVVPTVRHTLRLEEEGVDALVASGCEAGGHVGRVVTMPLVPQVVDAVKVPVIAAGGMMTTLIAEESSSSLYWPCKSSIRLGLSVLRRSGRLGVINPMPGSIS